VVQGSVDQNTTIIPSSRFNPDRLVNESTLDKRFVGDGDSYLSTSLSLSWLDERKGKLTVLAEKSNVVTISTPDDILDWRSSQFRKDLLLLNIEQGDGSSRREDKGSSSTVEDIIGLDGTFNSLDDIVGQIPSFDVLPISFIDQSTGNQKLTWPTLSKTASRFLATKIALYPLPFFPSEGTSFPSEAVAPVALGRGTNSY